MKQGDFTALAKYYHNRPAYSPFLLEKLIRCINDTNKQLKDLNIVEIGAGTGKLTKILASLLQCKIIAIEPNDAMRKLGMDCTKHHANVIWKKASAEETGLEEVNADWVIMASSFHWTNPKRSLPEFKRIMGGGNGYFTALYNPRHIVKGSIFDEIEEEIKRMVPELKRVSSGTYDAKNFEEILISTGDFKDCFFMECDYKEVWSKHRYIGAWHSVNDIQVQAGEQRFKQILNMIDSKLANVDTLEVFYRIRAWTVKAV